MSAIPSLANHFLIAMPTLADPNFERTVTLICQHNADGALGVVFNRTTNLVLADIFTQLELPNDKTERADEPVYHGGPVQTECGLILHDGDREWDATLQVGDSLSLTTSRDILEALATNEGPEHCLMALGYAGWGSGQLEREITENAWLSGPAKFDIIFSTPIEKRWTQAAASMGVDLTTMSREAGHA